MLFLATFSFTLYQISSELSVRLVRNPYHGFLPIFRRAKGMLVAIITQPITTGNRNRSDCCNIMNQVIARLSFSQLYRPSDKTEISPNACHHFIERGDPAGLHVRNPLANRSQVSLSGKCSRTTHLWGLSVRFVTIVEVRSISPLSVTSSQNSVFFSVHSTHAEPSRDLIFPWTSAQRFPANSLRLIPRGSIFSRSSRRVHPGGTAL
jgi:hypothetical protein